MRSPFFALIRKDLKAYFDQPTGYILVFIFVAVLSYSFFRSALLTSEASLRDLFTVVFTPDAPSLPWLLALFVPLATMRLLAEEQRDGTLEVLLTQPIRGWTVLLAKFLSGFLFVGITLLATLGIPIALETAGNLDEGAIVAQYVGSLFLAASFVAMGLFTSSLTRNQLVSAILGLTLSMVLMVMGLDLVAVTLPSRFSALLQALSPITHFSAIARGVLDLRDVLYFLALILTFLSATFLAVRAKSLSHRSPQYRNLQLGVAGLIVFSLLVGWSGSSIVGRLDLTEDKVFTLSPGTKRILADLDDLLTVELFASKDPPVQVRSVAQDVNNFLNDLGGSSRGKVKIVRRFPENEEEDARKAELAGVPAMQFNVQTQGELQIKTGYLGMALTYADRREVVPFIGSIDGFEYRLASLAYKMTQRQRRTVAFLAGHGEKGKDGELRTLAAQLAQQYDVIEVRATDGALPSLANVDALIIPGPTQKVPEGVREALRGYLDNGGKAMVLVDPVVIETGLVARRNRDSFADFVGRYGVVVEDDLVFDVQSNVTIPFPTPSGRVLLPYPYWMRVPTVDRNVAGEIESVVLPWASSLGITESQVGRVEVISLLETTPFSGIDFNPQDVSPNARVLNDLRPENLLQTLMGVAVTGRSQPGGGGSEGEAFRLVVVGDSDWLSDGLVSGAEENLALALNLMDWLAQEDILASVRSKVVFPRQLLFDSSTHRNVVQYANIIGVPLALVAIGLARYLRRRNATLRVYGREE